MPLSLHAATIGPFLQTLEAVIGLIDKAEAFCAERRLDPEALLQARLTDDMHPLAYQFKSVAVHSWGAIQGVRAGSFSPDMTPPPQSFETLRARLTEARDAVAAITPDEMEPLIGRDMRFTLKSLVMDFTAEGFLLSFSLPNFFFHAATAYDILRWQGVPIGKRDFLGKMQLRG